METVLGLVLVGVVVAIVRSARRARSSSPRPGSPPAAGSGVRRPVGPGTPPQLRREAEYPPETVDDAFAVGFIMGREFGHHDEPAAPTYVDDSHDVYSGDDDFDDDTGSGADW